MRRHLKDTLKKFSKNTRVIKLSESFRRNWNKFSGNCAVILEKIGKTWECFKIETKENFPFLAEKVRRIWKHVETVLQKFQKIRLSVEFKGKNGRIMR